MKATNQYLLFVIVSYFILFLIDLYNMNSKHYEIVISIEY